MRITCRDCRADFVLPPEQVDPRGKSSSCPFCKAAFQLAPIDEYGRQEVIFSGGEVRLRTCIECNKSFESVEDAVIPVCPSCKKVEVEVEEKKRVVERWRVEKDGRIFDHDSDAAVRDWIRHGLILPDDYIGTPDGQRVRAGRIPQFQNAFQSQRTKRLQPGSYLLGFRVTRKVFRPSFLLKWGFILCLSTSIGWLGYRVFSLPLPPPPTDPTIDRLVSRLRDRVTPPNRSVDVLIATARTHLFKDRREDYELSRQFLEQALLVEQTSPDVIGLLAMTYAYVSAFGDDPNVRISAIDLADLAIRMFPQRPEGYLAKARAALNANNLGVAREMVLRSIEVSSRSPEALLTQAAVMLSTSKTPGDLEQVITAASSATQKNPLLLEGYRIAAQAYFQLGEPDKAISLYEQRLQHSPDDSVAIYGMGKLEERAGSYSVSKEWYQQALRVSPQMVPARLALALIYLRIENETPKAERHVRNILTRYRRFATPNELFDAQRVLIEILTKTSRPEQTEEIANRFPPLLAASPELAIAHAKVLENRGQLETAIEKLKEALAAFPSSREIHFYLALTMEKHGTADEAVREYRTILEQNPTWLAPYLFLGRLFIQKDRNDEALDVVNAAVTRAGLIPDHDLFVPLQELNEPLPWDSFQKRFQSLATTNDGIAFPQAMMGLLRLQQGLHENNRGLLKSALASFQRARGMATSQEYTAIYVGRAHYHLGQWNSAATSFQEALKINPVSIAAQYWLGATYRRQGKLGQAEITLKTSLETTHWGFRALAELGHIDNARGKKAEAFDQWKSALQKEPRYLFAWKSLLEATRT